ncbi:MAG: PqqD family peptide modification chaperone [Halobacteriota archaeon]
MEYKENRTTSAAGSGGIITPEIDLTGMVVTNPDVSYRIEGENGALLFNPDTDNTLLVNPTGLSVWMFLAQPHTIDDIVAYLTTLFSDNPDPPTIKQDIEAFLYELAPDFISEVGSDATKLHSD